MRGSLNRKIKSGIKLKVKTAVFAALVSALALLGAGCKIFTRSQIELALLEKDARAKATPLEISSLYSAEEGYHYPGFAWGGTFKDFQEATNYAITDMEEGMTDTDTVFPAGDLHHTILGRANDSANVGCRDEDVISFVSMMFERDEVRAFQEFSANVEQALLDEFGTPTEETTRSETISGTTYQYKTLYWRKTIGTRTTELQWGTATIPGSALPAYAALGVAWYEE